jgi:hypothetical protein
VLTQSAWSIKRKKNCYLTSTFWRIAGRAGQKKAALAVAHRILSIVWHLIAKGGTYQEFGATFHEQKHPDRSARRLIRRLEQLGFEVDAKPKRENATRITIEQPLPFSPPSPTPKLHFPQAAVTEPSEARPKPVKPPKPKFQKLLVKRKPRTPKSASTTDANPAISHI